jgi:hypothetical protein
MNFVLEKGTNRQSIDYSIKKNTSLLLSALLQRPNWLTEVKL